MTVELEQQEWNAVLAMMAEIPWKISNPLILKIGEQLRAQAQGRPNGPLDGLGDPNGPDPRQRPS